MIAKVMSALVVAGSAQLSMAETSGIWADGVVTYPHPNGQLVNRDCQLFVPSMGQGEVKLKCGDWESTASEFGTRREAGKVVFSVIFTDVPSAPAGSAALYTGAYLRGSNKALYYGDVYSGSAQDLSLSSDVGRTYAGGFMFAKDIP